jgi:hypothetical protein
MPNLSESCIILYFGNKLDINIKFTKVNHNSAMFINLVNIYTIIKFIKAIYKFRLKKNVNIEFGLYLKEYLKCLKKDKIVFIIVVVIKKINGFIVIDLPGKSRLKTEIPFLKAKHEFINCISYNYFGEKKDLLEKYSKYNHRVKINLSKEKKIIFYEIKVNRKHFYPRKYNRILFDNWEKIRYYK